MNTGTNSFIMRNNAFAWLGMATCAILLIPLIAMQLTAEVNWTIGDFIVMGTLIFAFGSLFIVLARKVSPKNRLLIAVAVLAAFFYVWAELAVGIFTSIGS